MSDFIDFLNEKNINALSKEQQAAERQEMHKKIISTFFTKVRQWLSEAEKQGLLKIEERDFSKELTELLLDFRLNKIRISPESVNYLNNSSIRMRLNGYQSTSDKATFFSLKEGVWFLEERSSLFPKLTKELTKESFEEIIKSYL